MRPNATRRDHWGQVSIGAAALLLPPLALGAAFYSMLASPDEQVKGPAAVQTAAPTVAAAEPAALQPPLGQHAEDAARAWDRLPAQGGVAQTGAAQTGPISPTTPVHQVAATPAAAVNPPADAAAGGVTPPAADNPPAPPKRTSHRQAPRQPQQDQYPLRTWLQQIGILPRNAKDTRG